jgi:hypothetical protein
MPDAFSPFAATVTERLQLFSRESQLRPPRVNSRTLSKKIPVLVT